MRQWRYALVAAGVLLLLYGAVRLVAEVPGALPGLVLWMVGIVVIHDGLLSPLVVGVGWLLARTVPPTGRRYLQAALVIGGLITIIAILLGLVAAPNLAAYLVTAARHRHSDAPT